jgi:oligoendopeptidase F
MNAPFKTEALPEWNLADLYAGRDDPKIEIDLAAAKAANDELASLEGLFLQARREPERLGVLLDRGIKPGPSSRPTCGPAPRPSPPRVCSSRWS